MVTVDRHRRGSHEVTRKTADLTVRGLALVTLAATIGVLAWRWPTISRPVTLAVAVLVAIDRLTKRHR
ncbi:hypothetical protein Raf01_15570 [Rugosimonospora africana]|uniref:Uncharacterized protein n=1 Tax=Rugosimonospora africana TaxID=556532 RepID=A0A8J3QPJ3_9ACTN|nr:hypothetical protein Raf01_15570 [Rugosimonospora africana]